MADDKTNDDERPFTADERRAVRQLIQADNRRQWLVSTIKAVAIWVSAVSAGLIVLQDYIRKLLSGSGSH
jgi:hypothetical protein